jgi:hypothetical protein
MDAYFGKNFSTSFSIDRLLFKALMVETHGGDKSETSKRKKLNLLVKRPLQLEITPIARKLTLMLRDMERLVRVTDMKILIKSL